MGPIYLGSWIFWVMFSITLHELAHGWTAIRCGDRTPIETGHMTWNPLVHMGQTSLVMFALVGIAWGAMPINPANFRGRYDHAKVALAGPSMNVLLFAVTVCITAAIKVWGGRLDPDTYRNLYMFFATGAWLNLGLALFNLLPVPPLDGWRIASDLSPRYGEVWTRGNAPMLGLGIFFAIFFFGGEYIWGTAAGITGRAVQALVSVMGGVR